MYDSMVLMVNPVNDDDWFQLAITGKKYYDRRYGKIVEDL